MRGLVWRWVLNAAALYITAAFIEGVGIKGIGAALVAALVWGFVNTVIRPVISLITLPITIMTVGLFTLVINGLMLWLVSDVVDGFTVSSLWVGIFAAVILSFFSSIISALVEDK